mgnify:CR=1 FL=1
MEGEPFAPSLLKGLGKLSLNGCCDANGMHL